MTLLIKNILFGCFQPWRPEGFQALVRDAEIENKQHNGQSISLLSSVELPDSFDKTTAAYVTVIEQDVLLLHLNILHKTDKLDSEQDKFFLLTQNIDELWKLLEEISTLVNKPPFDTRDKEKANIAEFVLKVLELVVVNLVIDLGLRCSILDPDFSYSLDELYLTALDRPPPVPSPFRYTLEWYKRRLERILTDLSADLTLTVDRKRQIASVLEDTGRQFGYTPNASNRFNVQRLVHHAEDALFLVMMEAAFLSDDAGRLVDPDYCREWVEGMRQDILFGNSDKDVPSFLQKIDRAASELQILTQPFSKPFRDLAPSAAKKWISEWEELKRAGGNMLQMVRDDGGPRTEYRSGPADFATFFNRRYVHRQELAAVLKVNKRTLESYLEKGDIRKMELNNNQWYLRSDLEKFFDENTE